MKSIFENLIKTLILFVFLSISITSFAVDWEYDFSIPTEDNGTIYYKILNEELSEVEIVKGVWENPYTYNSITLTSSIEYNNKEYLLVSIIDNAFFECNLRCSLSIPKTVRYIGIGAFARNYITHLDVEEGNEYYISIDNSVLSIDGKRYILGIQQSEINIPNTVEIIEDFALCVFFDIPSDIKFGDNIRKIGNNVFVYNALNYSVNIIGDWSNVEYVGDRAINGINIECINFTDKLIHVGKEAFFNCDIHSSVYIGKNCEDFAPFSFAGGMTRAPHFIISEDNPWFTGDEDFIFNKDKTILLYSYCNKDVLIPNSVTIIGEYAFWKNGLKQITIPNSIERIEDYAFGESFSITEISIPNSVKYIGNNVFMSCMELSSIQLGNSIKYIGDYAFSETAITSCTIPGSVEKIGYSVFNYCKKLKELTFEESDSPIVINHTGQGAMYDNLLAPDTQICRLNIFRDIEYPQDIKASPFWGLNNLTDVSFSANVKCLPHDIFRNCSSLKNIINMYSIEVIGNRAFQGCSSLSKLNLGASFRSLALDALKECTSLVSINVDESNPLFESLNGVLFNKGMTSLIRYPAGLSYAYTIPDGVNKIEEGAFKESLLPNIQFIGSVKEIGPEACMSCPNLKNVYLGENIETIGDKAFYGCENLKEIYNYSQLDIEEGSEDNGFIAYYADHVYNHPQRIDDYIFEQIMGTYALTSYLGTEKSLVLPEKVDGCDYYIADNVFKGKDIASVKLPEGLLGIGEMAFYGCPLTDLNIPDNVTYIDKMAFSDCKNLKNLNLGSGIESIGEMAFYGCPLTDLNIPDNAIYIDKMAFSDCTELKSVYLGSGLDNLGESAFNGCYSLKEIWCMAIVPPTCERYIFNGVDKESCVLYVPEESYDIYLQVSPWKDFLNVEAGIKDTFLDKDSNLIIYTIDGKRIENVKTPNEYDNLPKGFYIINGRKVLKTR